MGARHFFEALADALGYARSNIVELFRYLRKPEVMNELARSNDRLREALTGENCKFISDVISSARLPLAALNRPEVARVFAPDPDTPQPHFREKEVVWVCIPQDSEDVALLAGATVHNLYNRVVKGRRGTYFFGGRGGVHYHHREPRPLPAGRPRPGHLLLPHPAGHLPASGQDRRRQDAQRAGQRWRPVLGQEPGHRNARYVSELSGNVQVRRAIDEHDGFERTRKQAFSAKGAPYSMREETRAGLPPEHVHGAPINCRDADQGDPHGIELLIPTPMTSGNTGCCRIRPVAPSSASPRRSLREPCRPPRRTSQTKIAEGTKGRRTAARAQGASNPSPAIAQF